MAGIDELHVGLDRMVDEAMAARQDFQEGWKEDVLFRRGEQWGHMKAMKPWQSKMVMNFLDTMIQREVGLLSDAKPTIRILPRRINTPMDMQIAETLQNTVEALWDEYSWGQVIERMLSMAATLGLAAMGLSYDPSLDFGRGDISVEAIDGRHVLFDPTIIAPDTLTARGSYTIRECVMPLAMAMDRWPSRLEGLQPDDEYSSFERSTESTNPVRSWFSRAGQLMTPLRLGGQGNKRGKSAYPRVLVQQFDFLDYSRNQFEEPYIFPLSGIKVPPGERLYPTLRRVVRVGKASRKIAVDSRNPYYDGLGDIEIFNWNQDIEHAMGSSEVGKLKSGQRHINQIMALMVENAALMQGGIWIGDWNALRPDQWDRLSFEPGQQVRKRPGSELRRDTGTALPHGTLELVSFLVEGMRNVVGLSGEAEGRSGTATSGVAIESLQIASQVLIRQRARQLEAFMTRLFRRIVPRIFQHFTTDRLLHINGPTGGVQAIPFEVRRLNDMLKEGDPTRSMANAWRDFRFMVTPGSSLGITRVQRIVLATDLYQLGLIDDEEVLKSAEWPNRDEVKRRVEEKKQAAMMLQMQGLQAEQGTANVTSPGGKRQPSAAPASTLGGPTGAAMERG